MTAVAESLDSPAEAGDKRRTLSLAQKFAVAAVKIIAVAAEALA